MRIFGVMLLLTVLALPAAFGGEEKEDVDRSEAVDIIKLLRDPYMIKRIEGIRKAGMINEPALIKEFKMLERLLGIARSRKYSKMERSESLKALINLAERRMANPVDLIRNLGRLVSNPDADIEVRLDALHLMASLGRVKSSDLREVYMGIKKIADEPDNPRAIRASAYRVFGSLAPNGAEDALYAELLRQKDLVIKEAILDGLKNFIVERSMKSQKMLDSIFKFTEKRTKPEEYYLRITGLETMQELMANGSELNRQEPLFKYLVERVTRAPDAEMITASQCLLRLNDDDPTAVFIDQFYNTKRGDEAKLALVMGAIELFNRLGQELSDDDTSRIDKTKAVASVKAILERLLLPMVKTADVLPSIKQIAIMGLGAVPRSFSRQEVAQVLIGVGLADSNQDIAAEAENSLMQIARLEKPFHTLEDKIDINGWKYWYTRNVKYLAANLVPWDREYDETDN